MNTFRKTSLALTLLASAGLTAALSQAASAGVSVFTEQAFTGDSDSGISSSNNYTCAVDLASPAGETINGVAFSGGPNPTYNGTNWYLFIDAVPAPVTGFGNSLTGNISKLASDFYYSSGAGAESVNLTGLTANTSYKLVFYNVGFGTGTRNETISEDGTTNSFTFDENKYGSGNGQLLIDNYTTGAGQTNYQVDFAKADTVAGSFHQYGFSNQVSAAPEPSQFATLGLVLLGVAGMVWRARRNKSVGISLMGTPDIC